MLAVCDAGGFAPGLDRHARGDEQGSVRVANVVETNDAHAGAAGDPLEALRDGVGMYRFAGGVGEHPPAAFDGSGSLFGLLPGSPRGEDVDGGGVKVDTATGVGGLAACLVHLVADGDEPTVDRDARGYFVVVVP